MHWNAAKAAEKHTRRSVLDGVSRGMPSLALAQKLLGKAANVGAPVPAPDAFGPESEAELGDALLALVQPGRAHGWAAEGARRERLRVLEQDIRASEGTSD